MNRLFFFSKKYFFIENNTSIGGTFTEFGGSAPKCLKSKYVNTSKNPVYCLLRYPFGKGSEEAIKTRE